ncbi:MAG: AsmA-like C-terminal region-containing protein [Desulfobacterales bacterium]|nr:AsmA-like C-terminal region-containing protein [Desulfobacterales bacterium]
MPLKIDEISLVAARDTFAVSSAVLMWEDHPLSISGDLTLAPGGVALDMEVSTNRLFWADVKKMMGKEDEREGDEKADSPREVRVDEAGPSWRERVHGKVRLKSDSFKYNDFIWAPLETDITLGRDKGIRVEITRADLCGISFPGVIEAAPGGAVSFRLLPKAEKRDLNGAIDCLLGEKMKISGDFDLEGRLESDGKGRGLLESLRGELLLKAENGRIDRLDALSRILAVLNLTEVLIGKDPDLASKGFAYNTITVNGVLDNGKFVFNEGWIDAAAMGVACQGEIDMIEKKVDARVLIAPFKTVDRVFGKIPVASDITGGSIISIPVRVKGDLYDARVIPLEPAAVGRGLLGVLERTITLPVKIIKPVFKKLEGARPVIPDAHPEQGIK